MAKTIYRSTKIRTLVAAGVFSALAYVCCVLFHFKAGFLSFDLKDAVMTVAAMLTAISIVIGIFCKNFMNFGGGLFRVTFENLPIIIAGIAYGPLVGGVVGVASDLVSYLLSSQTYPPNLIVTLGAFLIGASSGIVSIMSVS